MHNIMKQNFKCEGGYNTMENCKGQITMEKTNKGTRWCNGENNQTTWISWWKYDATTWWKDNANNTMERNTLYRTNYLNDAKMETSIRL